MIEIAATLLIILAFLFLIWCIRKRRVGVFLMVLGCAFFAGITGLKYGSEAVARLMDELGGSGTDLFGFTEIWDFGIWTEHAVLWQALSAGTAAVGLLWTIWEAFRNRS